MNQPVAPLLSNAGPAAPALRPLTAMIGRGSEMGRILGHLDARRSIRLQGAPGMGATALLRALCAEPPRPGTAQGTLALPVGLPVADLEAAAARLTDAPGTPVVDREMLVLLDDRALTGAEVDQVRDSFPLSVVVVTGAPGSDVDGCVPVVLAGLSQHHAVGLVEAAMGRSLSLDEGRAARAVATAVDGMPAALIQAAACVRHGGLDFGDVLDLLGEPPRVRALTLALQNGLDDDLHVTLSHVRALGPVPATTRVAAAACGLPRDEAARRLRRLAVLGLVFTDGRSGWTTADGLPPVSEPVRAGGAERVAAWLEEASEPLDLFDTASVLAVLSDRVRAEDRLASAALVRAAADTLALDGLDASRALLTNALAWATPVPEAPVVTTVPEDNAPADVLPGADPATVDVPAADESADDVESTSEQVLPAAAAAPEGAEPAGEPAPPEADAAATPSDEASGLLASITGDRRRLALIAIVSASVLAAVLLVVPMLRGEPTEQVLRGDVDLGVATVGESVSGTLSVDLSSTAAVEPVALVPEGPDAEAFALDPARCDTLDCRASVTFTPDRSGTHVATVRAVDDAGTEHAVVELTGSGTGDPPETTSSTDLSVTLFPSEPAPIPQGGEAVVPVGVRNAGPDESTGARLQVSVPDGVSAAGSGCSFENGTLTCPLADLPAGAAERVPVTLTAPDVLTQVRVLAQVAPITDADAAEGNNSAGFTYPVVSPAPDETAPDETAPDEAAPQDQPAADASAE